METFSLDVKVKKTDQELIAALEWGMKVLKNYKKELSFFKKNISKIILNKENFEIEFYDKKGKNTNYAIGINQKGEFCLTGYRYSFPTFSRPPELELFDLGVKPSSSLVFFVPEMIGQLAFLEAKENAAFEIQVAIDTELEKFHKKENLK